MQREVHPPLVTESAINYLHLLVVWPDEQLYVLAFVHTSSNAIN